MLPLLGAAVTAAAEGHALGPDQGHAHVPGHAPGLVHQESDQGTCKYDFFYLCLSGKCGTPK